IDERSYRQNLEQLSEMLNLSGLLKTPVRQLSLGQRMRCEIAASLLHNPKILFLDEPTIGLDAVSKLAVRDFILKLNKEKNTTVILTTHDMQDIEALTNRIILIGKGRILLDGSIDDIKEGCDCTEEALAAFYRSHNI
ncbi:MAG: ATP-binding cassette domain-containing protein, partial [Lachnospiraceae bacterium]|nr:ATP-binding cassette domain-containing protein [Lachnospiraceae bacterium]